MPTCWSDFVEPQRAGAQLLVKKKTHKRFVHINPERRNSRWGWRAVLERLMAIGRWRKIATAAAAAADAAPAAVFAAGYCWQLLLPLGVGVPCARVLKRG